jgi:hypothetical protein
MVLQQHQSVITSLGLLQSPRLSSIETTCSEKYSGQPVTSSPLIYSTLQPVHNNSIGSNGSPSLDTLKYLNYNGANQWLDLSRKQQPASVISRLQQQQQQATEDHLACNQSPLHTDNFGYHHHEDNLINNSNQNTNNSSIISQVHQNRNHLPAVISSDSSAADMRSTSLLLDGNGSAALTSTNNITHPIEIELDDNLVDGDHDHQYLTLESAAAVAHLHHEFKENHHFNHIINNNSLSVNNNNHTNNNSVSSVSGAGGESPPDEDYDSGLPNYTQLTSLQSRLQDHHQQQQQQLNGSPPSHQMYATSSPIPLHVGSEHSSIIHHAGAYENLHHHPYHQGLAG